MSSGGVDHLGVNEGSSSGRRRLSTSASASGSGTASGSSPIPGSGQSSDRSKSPLLHYRRASPATSILSENLELDAAHHTYTAYENGHTLPTRPDLSPPPPPSTLGHSRLKLLPTPVPYGKIFPLCLARISEGMIYSVILPYINEMIRGFGVKEEKVGVWSAMAEGALMVTEAITAPLFAPLADRYGRRPVFLICVFLWGVGAIVFGLVRSVFATIAMRGFLGLLAGAGVLSRTMVGELCDKSNRIKAFAVFSPSLTLGLTLGPAIGGFLANPIPRLLSPSLSLFSDYPYLLPSIVAGVTGFLAWLSGALYLPETLPTLLRRSAEVEIGEKGPRPGVGQLLRYKPFQNVLILYGITNGVQFSFEALYPLFAFTRKDLGGLELSTETIGVVLAFSAGLSIVMTIFLFPILHRAIPEDIYLMICLSCYPVAVLFFPVLWAMHSSTNPRDGLGWGTIGMMSLQMVVRRMGDFSATMLDTIIFETIPSPSLLVMANSLTFSIGGIGRAIGPFVISYVFSLSTHYPSTNPLRQMVWLVFVLIGLPGVWLAWIIVKEGRGQSHTGTNKASGRDEEERVELIDREER